MDKYLIFKGRKVKDGDGLYVATSLDFFHGSLDGISRCLKASIHDAGVVDGSRIRLIAPPRMFTFDGCDRG